MTFHSYSGLYYPFIHFKNDNWLKLSALYWDHMGRIVPESYQTEDSDTVKELGNFVEILRPGWVTPEFGETFIEFVQENGKKLRKRYSVKKREGWPVIPLSHRPPKAGGLSGSDPRLGYVFYEKMSPILSELLYKSGIALPDQADPKWVGMHPKLTQVYMTALADQLAGDLGLFPISDETIDHLAVGGWTMERLAQALLEDVNLVTTRPKSREVESFAAYVAIRTVLPKDIDNLSVERILRFREKYPNERTLFQQHIRDFVRPREWLADIKDEKVLEKRLESEYQRELAPKINELKEKFRSVNIDTVTSALSIQIAVPSLIAQGAVLLGVTANPIGGILAGTALALIPVLRDHRKAKGELSSSSASYLQRIEEELQPHQLTQWIWQGIKRFGIRG